MPANTWYTDANGRTMVWQPNSQIREYMDYLGGTREDAMRALGLDPSLDENDPDSGLGSWVEGSFANPNGLAPWKPILGMALAGAGGQALVNYAAPYIGGLLSGGTPGAAATPTLASAGIPVSTSTAIPAGVGTAATLGSAGLTAAIGSTAIPAGVGTAAGMSAPPALAAGLPAAVTSTAIPAGVASTPAAMSAAPPIAAAAGPSVLSRIMQVASIGREAQEARAAARAAEARNLYLQDNAALNRWYQEQQVRMQRDEYADRARPDRLRAAAFADYNGKFPTVTWTPEAGFSGGFSPSQLTGPRFTEATRAYGDEARNRAVSGADRQFDPAPEPTDYPSGSTLDTILGIIGLAGRGYSAYNTIRNASTANTDPLPSGTSTAPGAPTARTPRATPAAPLARDQYGLLDELPNLFTARAANGPNRGNQYNATFGDYAFGDPFDPATRTVGRRRTP